MASLARVLLREGDARGCVTCLQKAVAINPLNEGSWFTMGCAALQCDDYETAVMAFRRCVGINEEVRVRVRVRVGYLGEQRRYQGHPSHAIQSNQNSEAWNNMGSAYIKLGEMTKAAQALAQALKSTFDSWKMWENYLNVTTEIKGIGLGLALLGMQSRCVLIGHRLVSIVCAFATDPHPITGQHMRGGNLCRGLVNRVVVQEPIMIWPADYNAAMQALHRLMDIKAQKFDDVIAMRANLHIVMDRLKALTDEHSSVCPRAVWHVDNTFMTETDLVILMHVFNFFSFSVQRHRSRKNGAR
jgi:tetratricopeptide (TPR) repeat protein